MGVIQCPVCKTFVEGNRFDCTNCGAKFDESSLPTNLKAHYEIDAFIYSIFSLFFFPCFIFQGLTMSSIVESINKKKSGGNVMIGFLSISLINFIVSCILCIALIAFIVCLVKLQIDYSII